MRVEQVYNIANDLTKQYIGEEAVLNEDLSNLVDIGSATINLSNLDRYVNSLIDQIGKVVFVNRPYTGVAPSLYMDGWEYGAILEKVTYDSLPIAEENETWKLTNGTSYDPNIFTQPDVSAKFFSKKVTFDIPMSFAERQVKSAFQNATQLNSFFSMIETAISTSMTVKIDSLAMGALNTLMANVINGSNSNTKVNLLSMYNSTFGKELTPQAAISDPEFIRYASYIMGLYSNRMERLSVLFNEGGKERFTPNDRKHVIMLAEFAEAAKAYLQSDTYHDEFVRLPSAEIVPYWQGTGTNYAFSSTSNINVIIKTDSATATVNQSGILAVMFDRYAVGVANLDRRVTTNYNARAEFFNNWYKFDAGYFYDNNEQAIVFYVA